MHVKVLGSGCRNCQMLEKNVKEAIQQLDTPVTVEKVTDFTQIAMYGVMSTPALVIDEVVVSSGRVNEVDEIVLLLNKR